MVINDFIEKFAMQFEEIDAGSLTPDTNFKLEIAEWDSLIALSVIAMVDAEYGVILKGDDIVASKTIEDLFKIVISRKNEL